MEARTAYEELRETGMATQRGGLDAAAELKRAMIAIVERIEAEGALACKYPWALAREEATELTRRTGWVPAGGWAAVVSLMASSGLVSARSLHFQPVVTREELEALPAEHLRRRSLEGFTRWLAPPAPAAHVFVALHIHPLWGLRLVSSLECPYRASPPSGARPRLLPETGLPSVGELTFGFLSILVGALRGLDEDREYSLGALARLCSAAAEVVAEHVEVPELSYDVLRIMLRPGERMIFDEVIEQSWRELLEEVFVATGALRIFDNGMFRVQPGALDGVSVGEGGREDEEIWLERLRGHGGASRLAS